MNYQLKKYPKYKPSGIEWIGEIPEHWDKSNLKYSLKNIVSGGTPSTSVSEYWTNENGIPWVSISDISRSNGKLIETEKAITLKAIRDCHLLVVPKGTILISIFASLGKMTILDIDAVVNQAILGLVENNSILISSFIKYYLLFIEQYISYYSSSNTQKNLNLTKIKNLPIFLPSLPEQTAIAKYLDDKTAKIDSLIEKKKRLIELYKEERTAVINHYVLGQHLLSIDNGQLTMDNSQLSINNYKLPKGWQVKKLKYVAKVNPSIKSFSFQKNSNDEVVFLPMEKVSEDGSINQEIKKKISEVCSGFTYFERGDIILAKITPCFENGKAALLNKLETNFGFGSTEFHTLRNLEIVLKDYLFLILKSKRFMTIGEAFMTGSAGQKRVPTEFVKEFESPIPPLEEQHQIVQHIEAETKRIDSRIAKIEKEIELLKEYRTALISEVVTGKIKVIDN